MKIWHFLEDQKNDLMTMGMEEKLEVAGSGIKKESKERIRGR